jgi:hypothetical protein
MAKTSNRSLPRRFVMCFYLERRFLRRRSSTFLSVIRSLIFEGIQGRSLSHSCALVCTCPTGPKLRLAANVRNGSMLSKNPVFCLSLRSFD